MFEFTILDTLLFFVVFFTVVLAFIIVAAGIVLFFGFTVELCTEIEKLYKDFLDDLFS